MVRVVNSFGVMVRVRVEIRIYVNCKTVLFGRKTIKTQKNGIIFCITSRSPLTFHYFL